VSYDLRRTFLHGAPVRQLFANPRGLVRAPKITQVSHSHIRQYSLSSFNDLADFRRD